MLHSVGLILGLQTVWFIAVGVLCSPQAPARPHPSGRSHFKTTPDILSHAFAFQRAHESGTKARKQWLIPKRIRTPNDLLIAFLNRNENVVWDRRIAAHHINCTTGYKQKK